MKRGKPGLPFIGQLHAGDVKSHSLKLLKESWNLLKKAELVFCPCLMDVKYADVEKMEEDYIDVTLFNGAIRK